MPTRNSIAKMIRKQRKTRTSAPQMSRRIQKYFWSTMKRFTSFYKPFIFIQLALCFAINLFLLNGTYTSDFTRNGCVDVIRNHMCIECGEPSKMPVLRMWSSIERPDYFSNILNILNRVGYRIKYGIMRTYDWDLYWLHEYHGRQFFYYGFADRIRSSDRVYQKVNHFPGIGEIVTKSKLVHAGGKYIPAAFVIPEQKEAFLKEINKTSSNNRTWIQKDRHQSGVFILPTKDLDLNSKIIIQEFVANPFLVSGYKINMGIYVVLTSINPLRAYILDSTFSVRYCSKKYIYGDYSDVATYNTDLKERQETQDNGPQEKLLGFATRFGYNRLKALYGYLRKNGVVDPSVIRKQVYEAIRDVLVTRERSMQLHKNSPKNAGNSQNLYFEIMRADVLIDDNLGVHLLEFNMSPDLSLDYVIDSLSPAWRESVVFNCFNVALLTDVRKRGTLSSSLLTIRDSDINAGIDTCFTSQYTECNKKNCSICTHCMSDETVFMIKMAYAEHINRKKMRRVYPEEMTKEDAARYKRSEDVHLSVNNQLTRAWFRAKCIADSYWCS